MIYHRLTIMTSYAINMLVQSRIAKSGIACGEIMGNYENSHIGD